MILVLQITNYIFQPSPTWCGRYDTCWDTVFHTSSPSSISAPSACHTASMLSYMSYYRSTSVGCSVSSWRWIRWQGDGGGGEVSLVLVPLFISLPLSEWLLSTTSWDSFRRNISFFKVEQRRFVHALRCGVWYLWGLLMLDRFEINKFSLLS